MLTLLTLQGLGFFGYLMLGRFDPPPPPLDKILNNDAIEVFHFRKYYPSCNGGGLFSQMKTYEFFFRKV